MTINAKCHFCIIFISDSFKKWLRVAVEIRRENMFLCDPGWGTLSRVFWKTCAVNLRCLPDVFREPYAGALSLLKCILVLGALVFAMAVWLCMRAFGRCAITRAARCGAKTFVFGLSGNPTLEKSPEHCIQKKSGIAGRACATDPCDHASA